MIEVEESGHKTSGPAAHAAAQASARTRSESATLAVAVMLAVAFGVGLGMWVTARLPPPPSAGAAASSRLLPDARASAPPAPAVEPTPAQVPAVNVEETRPTTDAGATTVKAREATPDAEPKGVTNHEPAAPATTDPSRPVAWQVRPSSKARARALAQGAEQGGERSSDSGAQAQPEPCALYASASALSVPLGGAAALILGGPGQGVRINVNTPDWSEIAVIYEGPAAGHNGWLRYSVRSVGRRPGLYTVRFSTPCGSQTIRVTVR